MWHKQAEEGQMSNPWRRRFFHWATYLTLVAYVPVLGLTWLIFHHPPGRFVLTLWFVGLITSAAQQAQKETRRSKAPVTKPAPPSV